MSNKGNIKENKEDSVKKERRLQIRLDEENFELIEGFAKASHTSKSELARKSINTFIHLNIENQDRSNPKLLMSRNMLKVLLDAADSDVIKQFADVSFQNGQADYTYFKNVLIPPEISQLYLKDGLKSRLSTIMQYVFASDAQNWFDDIDHIWGEEEDVTIKGTHTLGQNFSLFIKHLLTMYLNLFQYEIIQENYQETTSTTLEKHESPSKQVYYSLMIKFAPINDSRE